MGESRKEIVLDTQEQMAQLIRTEMVCCDIYERVNLRSDPYPFGESGEAKQAWKRRLLDRQARMVREISDHAICYYGEMAAHYVLDGVALHNITYREG